VNHDLVLPRGRIGEIFESGRLAKFVEYGGFQGFFLFRYGAKNVSSETIIAPRVIRVNIVSVETFSPWRFAILERQHE
jgi:hypothetical protein